MASDRRAEGVARIPFEAMVEVGGSLGPTFEAQAVNLSPDGMQIRTPYLPEIGQPITCRFDAGEGMVVVAAGDVLWRQGAGDDGGEFGVRFTNLDAESARTLSRILGIDGVDARDELPKPQPGGRKIRLHIEGLASPMRARVKDMNASSVTAFSDLGFLQVGKPLELEDAASGSRRPAFIDKVEVELDRATMIPQLVVSLRYDDVDAHAPMTARAALPSDAPVTMEAPVASRELAATASGYEDEDGETDDEDVAVPVEAQPAAKADADDDIEEESANLKGPIARTASKVTPALMRLAEVARERMAILAAKTRGGQGDDIAIPTRRTTAPAPGGGLHTAGRKVIRGELASDPKLELHTPRFPLTKKKKIAAGCAIGLASILAFAAMRPSPPPAPVAERAPETAPAAPPPPAEVVPVQAATPPQPAPSDDPFGIAAAESGPVAAAEPAGPRKKVKVAPFGNGAVGSNGNILRLKMDGVVEQIHGASQPTGFTVVIPNRKSLDAAAPLAARDPRIAAMRVSNEVSGAELSVTFKDGVPPYLVRANGENLELVLARPGHASDEKPAAATRASSPTRKKPAHKRH